MSDCKSRSGCFSQAVGVRGERCEGGVCAVRVVDVVAGLWGFVGRVSYVRAALNRLVV